MLLFDMSSLVMWAIMSIHVFLQIYFPLYEIKNKILSANNYLKKSPDVQTYYMHLNEHYKVDKP